MYSRGSDCVEDNRNRNRTQIAVPKLEENKAFEFMYVIHSMYNKVALLISRTLKLRFFFKLGLYLTVHGMYKLFI